MRLVVTRRATADLHDIRRYYHEIDPDLVGRVTDDIDRTLELLIDYLMSGQAIKGVDLRKRTTGKYRFVLSHAVLEDRVEIVGIFRHQDRAF